MFCAALGGRVLCDYQALLLRVNIWKFPLVGPGPEKEPLGRLSKVLLNLFCSTQDNPVPQHSSPESEVHLGPGFAEIRTGNSMKGHPD